MQRVRRMAWWRLRVSLWRGLMWPFYEIKLNYSPESRDILFGFSAGHSALFVKFLLDLEAADE